MVVVVVVSIVISFWFLSATHSIFTLWCTHNPFGLDHHHDSAGVDSWFSLLRVCKESEVTGEVLLRLLLSETATGLDQLTVTVVRARDVKVAPAFLDKNLFFDIEFRQEPLFPDIRYRPRYDSVLWGSLPFPRNNAMPASLGAPVLTIRTRIPTSSPLSPWTPSGR